MLHLIPARDGARRSTAAIESTPRAHGLDLRVGLHRAERVIQSFVEALIVGTFIAQAMKLSGTAPGIARFFDADVKVNLPTGFKVFSMAAAALLAWVLSHQARAEGDRWSRHWLGLSIALTFLMVDEMAYVHQSLASFLGDGHDGPGGIFHFAWVLVYLPVALAAGAFFLPFVFGLRHQLRAQLVAAGLLFCGGSAGVELLKGRFEHLYGEQSAQFVLTTAFSDSFEMIGLGLCVCALLRELARRAGQVTLRLDVE